MAAGGNLIPYDQDVKKHVSEDFKKVPVSKPSFTLGDIKKAVPPHCFQRSLIRSFSYVGRDLILLSVFYYLATTYIHQLPYAFRFLAWPIYWLAQGCVFMGLWQIGHECGHHAFSDHSWLDDVVGFVVHSCLFTPYFSWKFSHKRHHSNTGSLEYDEVYVPKVKSKLSSAFSPLNNTIGHILTLLVKLSLGWHIYLSINAAGRPYERFASHYDPKSPIFSENERALVVLSDIGLVSVVFAVYKLTIVNGFSSVFFLYGGGLTVMNAFVVIVTFLQHTHPSIPRYDRSKWNWLNGVFTTVDRDYGVLNKVFHNVTDTHVIHHLFAYMPHYHAMEATKAIKPLLGEYYQYDSTPFYVALWRESVRCLFVEPDERDENKGTYWYSDKY